MSIKCCARCWSWHGRSPIPAWSISSEWLAKSQKVAFRLHDAFLVHPAGLTATARAETLEHFSPAQIVELALKFLYWSSNRPPVALGSDAPHDVNRLTSFHYGENGEYIVHPAKD